METFIQEIATIGQQIVQFSWLPLLIWTVFCGIVWAALRFVSNIHPQYQYHGRLALLFALPAGFIAIGIIQIIENLLATSSTTSSLSLISVAAPFELTVTAASANALSTVEILYALSLLFLIVGLVLFVLRNILQWFQLHRLQSSCEFSPIQKVSDLDKDTLGLIKQTDKVVQISFLDQEVIHVTFGLRKPVIVLPESIKRDSEKLNLVLQHELTHIIQNDFLSNIAISLTQIVFWFHPLVHVLKRELIDYREIRCDSLVLSNQSVSRKKYASLLLELLPMPNINKELSVNMAQESSNLKKRIQMITQQSTTRSIPKRSSAAIFTFIILCTAIAMSCTDIQTDSVFDEEGVNLMTDVDQNGDRGYHQIKFFPANEEFFEKEKEKIEQLNRVSPEHIHSIEVYKGQQAIDQFGPQASAGAIVINTQLNPNSYNEVLTALGMEEQDINVTPSAPFLKVSEEMPQLIGGLEELQKNIKYPEDALEKGIEGRVFVQFIVNKDGNVSDAKVIRGIGGGADEEALRVVREAKFEPGYQNGEPVRVQYALPISFRLNTSTEEVNSDQVYEIVDEAPELIGGWEGLRKNIRYPEEAKRSGVEGRVYIQLIVNKQGNVENAKVVRGLGYGADEEALRVIREAKFEPGYQNGEPVRVQYSLAISFVLPEEESQQ